jgi:alkanesulfonate monooxygenase SsuD/methylene tetrahydromethanopterin reductase-like flavin-dependent oxidoreductase (luciferase family)
MQIGLSVTSAHPRTTDPRVSARWVVERAAACRAAGFASFSIGDHHATPAPYMQNVPMLARCLAELSDMRVVPLFLLPLWHPVLLAEQLGTLSAIAEGPLDCILAIGNGDSQFAPFEVGLDERRARMEEALPLLRRLLTEERVSHDGHYWHLRDVTVSPRPERPPQLWVGASAGVAVRRAGRLGDAWLAAPGAPMPALQDQLETYREAADAADRLAKVEVFPVRRDVYVGSSDAEALETAAGVLAGGYRGFDPDVLIVGGPETTIARLRELQEAGFDHTLIRFLPVGQEEILESIARIGSDVIPALR